MNDDHIYHSRMQLLLYDLLGILGNFIFVRFLALWMFLYYYFLYLVIRYASIMNTYKQKTNY